MTLPDHDVLVRAAAAVGENEAERVRLTRELIVAAPGAVAAAGDAFGLDRAERFASFVGGFGAEGAALASAVTECATSRLARGEAVVADAWPSALARVLLVDVVRPTMGRHPAVFGAFVMGRRGLRGPGAVSRVVQGGVDLCAPTGAVVAAFDVGIGANMERLLAALQAGRDGLVVERLVRFLPRRTAEQYRAGVNPCNRLEFDTLGEFGVAAGIRSGRDCSRIPEALELLRDWRGDRRDLPPLLDYWFVPRGGLIVTVLDGLAYPFQEACERLPPWVRRMQRVLIPVLAVPDLSWASTDKYSSLCALQWELLLAMRNRVADYPAGFVFSKAEISEAAAHAQVSRRDANTAVELAATGPRPWLRPHERGHRLKDPAADALFLEATVLTRRYRPKLVRSSVKRR